LGVKAWHIAIEEKLQKPDIPDVGYLMIGAEPPRSCRNVTKHDLKHCKGKNNLKRILPGQGSQMGPLSVVSKCHTAIEAD
jgi:hypothetical protein